MIAMVVIGCVLLPVFVFWDFKFAKFPVVERRFIFNRSVVGAALIGFFDFVRIRSPSRSISQIHRYR